MGFFKNIVEKIKGVFLRKGDISKERIKQISLIEKKFPGFSFTENSYKTKHLLLFYNGYLIALAYNNVYIKQFNYEVMVTDTEMSRIMDVYKILDDIYAERL